MPLFVNEVRVYQQPWFQSPGIAQNQAMELSCAIAGSSFFPVPTYYGEQWAVVKGNRCKTFDQYLETSSALDQLKTRAKQSFGENDPVLAKIDGIKAQLKWHLLRRLADTTGPSPAPQLPDIPKSQYKNSNPKDLKGRKPPFDSLG
jgi:hypothetical protein